MGDERRIGQHRLAAFHVDEMRGLVEIEVEFLLIEQMKRGDVVPLKTEMPYPVIPARTSLTRM